MDEGKFVADFVAKNIENIFNIGKKSFHSFDETIQIKLKTAYTSYLNNTREKYSKSKSFFIRNESVDLYAYYEAIGIQSGNIKINEPSFEKCLNSSNRLIITGTGGSGKSVLIKHLFLDCINHQQYTPILIELRDLNDGKIDLNKSIESTLEQFGFNISGDYINKAKKEGHFCFLLDGYDEVNYAKRKKLLTQIKKLSNSFSKCPIIISSRPDDVFNGIDDFRIFQVMPLTLKSASKLIKKLPFDNEIKTKFTDNLASGLFDKHKSFLSNPLLLSIMLLTYGENAEIPSKLSIFYNQAYEALFQRHDANKGGYKRDRLTKLDIQDFQRVFSLFSLQTYEKRLFKMTKIDCLSYIKKSKSNVQQDFNEEDYLSDLLSAACLLMEDGLEIAFSHRSFQEYFVALHISTAQPAIQEKLIERYWKNIHSDEVIRLLLELNPDLLERLLIIPQLEKLFNDLGVKTKVGISHSAKYFKLAYSQINVDVDDDIISATVSSNYQHLSTLVHLTIEHCESYVFPNKSYFKKDADYMYKQYGEIGDKKVFETKNMSYKTPILKDLLTSKGAFSTQYLQAAFTSYKILKVKHENSLQNIDDLFGIA
jgi:predicted NACHT family NTPase